MHVHWADPVFPADEVIDPRRDGLWALRIAGRNAPDGETALLVLHGGLGWDHSYLHPALDVLAEALPVIYFDFRGNGRSVRPGSESLTMDAWVEDVRIVQEDLGCSRVALFGHSFGGAVAQEYALRYPQRVSALLLCGAYPAFDYFDAALERLSRRANAEQLAIVQAASTAPVPDDATLAAASRALLPLYFSKADPTLLRAFDQVVFSAAAFNRSFLDALPQFSTVDRLPSLEPPVLSIGGADDWIAPPTQATERLARLTPNGSSVVLAGSGHFPFLEEPGRFLSHVVPWLTENARTASA